MKLLSDRNDRVLLGAAGVLLSAGLVVGAGQGVMGGGADLMTSTAIAAATPSMAHNVAAEMPASIVRSPTDLPAARQMRGNETVRVQLETIERMGNLADGASYRYWTFNGQVPGPFVRVRVGDTVEVSLKNHEDSWMQHNVDFHAVTGPGGGGVATVADPGATKGFTFKALNPGLFVYHCAVPMAAQHIANGMYGLILVEPEGGLPPVDHEFYVMQGEIYTEEAFGTTGELTESYDKLLNEMPEYYVFNGAANALAEGNALNAKVGETVRIYFGVGGPNKTSSFHVIGEIFDHAYNLASLTAEPLTNVQTITVPPGGAAAVDFKVEVPGTYVLVDHALSRAARGLIGQLVVEGADQPEIFTTDETPAQMGMNH
jgi:nitrite reductase (NO-forming)